MTILDVLACMFVIMVFVNYLILNKLDVCKH